MFVEIGTMVLRTDSLSIDELFTNGLNGSRMTTRVPKTLRDVGNVEAQMTLFQTGVNETCTNCVKGDVLEERV